MVELPRGCGVVLDLDDTLYPERSFHDSGFRWIARQVGLDPSRPEVAEASRQLRSGGRPLDGLQRATGIPSDTLLAWHRCHSPDIHLYDDARDFLSRLSTAGVPTVLLTDGRSVTQRLKIEALGIADSFQAILISEETGHDKYDEQSFALAAHRLGNPSQIVSFGDNPEKDLAIPTNLGWLVYLMLDRGDNVHPQSITQSRSSVAKLRSFDEVRIQS